MGYGLTTQGKGGIYFIESTSTGAITNTPRYMTVWTSGTVAALETLPANTYLAGDLLFARPSNGSGPCKFSNNVEPGETDRVPPLCFMYDTTYFVLRPTNTELATNKNGATHGLRVYNSATPPVLIYDSRHAVSGMNITHTFPPNTFPGGIQGHNPQNATQPSQFAELENNTVWKTLNQAEWDRQYMLMAASAWSITGLPGYEVTLELNQYNYYAPEKTIYFVGFTHFGWGGVINSIPNNSHVVMGALLGT